MLHQLIEQKWNMLTGSNLPETVGAEKNPYSAVYNYAMLTDEER